MSLPVFTDYRTTNDGVMVADVGFKKQLWALDPELDVVWDWGSEKWEIWKFPGQARKMRKLITPECCHVMTIQTKERSFRELGADILLRLQAGDTKKYGAQQLADYFDQVDENLRRAKFQKFKNWIRDVTLESFDYARGVVKRSVPFSYKIKPSEEKLLLKSKPIGVKSRLITPSKEQKITNAIGG